MASGRIRSQDALSWVDHLRRRGGLRVDLRRRDRPGGCAADREQRQGRRDHAYPGGC